MNDFKFTKALMNQTSATPSSNLHSMTDVARLERIHDNMAGINPITKQSLTKPTAPQTPAVQPVQEQNNQLHEQMEIMNNLKPTNN